jgi:imidazolonepropionase
VDRITDYHTKKLKSRWRNIKFGQKLNESSEEEIYNQSKVRLEEVRLGTGAVEIKSGYGLTLGN